MDPILLVKLTFVHFIADFMLQSDWMAQNKSKNLIALNIHCFVYALPFLVFCNIEFVCFLLIAHWFVDFCTSRLTAPLFREWYDEQFYTFGSGPKGSLHYFFVVIGFDQWLHFVTLVLGIHLFGIK